MNMRFTIAAFLGISMANITVWSATIEIGDIEIPRGVAEHTVELFVSGDALVRGLEFNVQVGDGGIDVGGVDTGPLIAAVDLTSGTIFTNDGAVATQTDVVTFPLARQAVVDADRAVPAQGQIATITFDTRNAPTGTFDLRLTDVGGGFDTSFFDSQGAPLATFVANGTVTVIPEPQSLICLAWFIVVLEWLQLRRSRYPFRERFASE